MLAGSDGSVDLRLLARALAGTGALHVLPDPSASTRDLRGSGPGSPDEASDPGSEDPPADLPLAGREAPDGSLLAYLFTDGERARTFARKAGLAEGEVPVLTLAAPPEAHLRDLLDGDRAGAYLDPGSEHTVLLPRDSLERLLAHLTGRSDDRDGPRAEAPGPAKDPLHSAHRPLALEPPATDGVPPAVRRLGATRIPPPVPPPGGAESDSTDRLRELARSWTRGEIAPWALLDAVSDGLDLWVPVDPEPVHGLRWPLAGKHPDGSGRTVIHVFTSASAARKTREASGRSPEVRHLSGIEALRWIWAAPVAVSECHLHYDPGRRWLPLQSRWALSAIYPHFLHVPDLAAVDRIAPDRLGRMPGRGGSRAPCVRALVEGGKTLTGVRTADSGTPALVDHEGGRYLPVFSGADAYFDFDAANPEASGEPAPPSGADPFRTWLLAGGGADGAILDPASPSPLVLDLTDLLFLSMWVRHGERPDGTRLVRELAGLVDEIGPERTARILADWPQYILLSRTGRSGDAQVVTTDGGDRLVGFTNRGDAERYLGRFVEITGIGGRWGPIEHLTGWTVSLFERVDGQFGAGARLDPPGPHGDGGAGGAGGPDAGLEVTPAMARAALERIDEKLTPRVEGFRV